ncbi:hypothetical protein ACM66B_004189 [Microbotryomycetes sp. NB124-2]
MTPVHARIHASQSDYFDGTHSLIDGRHVLQPMTPPQRKLRDQQKALNAHVVKNTSSLTASASGSTSGVSSSAASSSGASSSGAARSIGRKLKSLTWGSKKLLTSAPMAPSSLSQSTLAPSESSRSTSTSPRPTTPSLMRPPASPLSPNSPFSGAEHRRSTLVAFPRPPAVAQQHAVSAILPARELFHASDSASIVSSTHKTTSSFASSSLFMHTDDEDASYSEATSMSSLSSVNSARDKLWRVKGLSEPAGATTQNGGLLAVQEVDEDNLSVSDSRRTSRRNSASMADFVAAMLADPETPERPRRWSASSVHQSQTNNVTNERESPRQRARLAQQPNKPVSVFNGPRWRPGHNVRIPSMRFDGLAMDQAFEEIEKRVEGSPRRRFMASTSSSSSELKSNRRRTRVLSTYRPTSTLPDALQVQPLSPESKVERGTLTLSAGDLESLRAPSPNPSMLSTLSSEAKNESLLEEMQLGPETCRPASSTSRRALIRPAPVDVELANLTFFGPVQEGPRSRSPSARSPRARSLMSAKPCSPAPLLSPLIINTARVSAPAAINNKATLGTPISLVSDKYNSKLEPAVATTPTSPIPKVCIFAPNSQLAQSSSEAESLAAIERGRVTPKVTTPVSVKVVEPKRVVRLSTRAPPARPNKSLRRKPSLPLMDTKSKAEQSRRSKTPPPALPSPASSFASRTSPVAMTLDPKRTSATSSTGSDCEAQLDNLMHKLTQPYSPPVIVRDQARRSPTTIVVAHDDPTAATTPIKRDFSQDSLSRESPLRPRVLVTNVDECEDEHGGNDDDDDEMDEDERKRLTILRQHDAELAERSEQDRQRLDQIAQMMMAAATVNGRWTPTNGGKDDQDEDNALTPSAVELHSSPQLESPVDPSMVASFARGVVEPVAASLAAPASYKSRPLSAVFEEDDQGSVYSDEGRCALPELDEEDGDVDGAGSRSSVSGQSTTSQDLPLRLAPAAVIYDPIEQEINATLASIESHPAFDPSMFSFGQSAPPPSAIAPSDSFTSSRSSIAYLAESPKASLSHSRTISSDLGSMFSQDDVSSPSASGGNVGRSVVATRYVSHYRRPSLTNSVRTHQSSSSVSSVGASSESSGSFDLGVVMMGQRVSCTYEVGLAL